MMNPTALAGWLMVWGLLAGSGASRELMQKTGCVEEVFQPRIAFGVSALDRRYPYMASLSHNFAQSGHLCGGVLVAPDLVVTAAHCVDPGVGNSVLLPDVLIGTNQLENALSQLIDGVETFKACEVRIHKGYNSTTEENDIALIILSSKSSKQPISLNKEKVGPKQQGRVLGWGKTEIGELSTDLQQLDVEIISNRECDARIGSGCKTCPIFDSMICADGKKGDACAGDSGGPLIMSLGDTTEENPCDDVLLGVVSYGKTCGTEESDFTKPGVYTRISEYISWIETRGESDSTIFSDPDIEICFTTNTGEVELVEEESSRVLPPPSVSESYICLYIFKTWIGRDCPSRDPPNGGELQRHGSGVPTHWACFATHQSRTV